MFLFNWTLSFGQRKLVDSLQHHLNHKSLSVPEKFKVYNMLVELYRTNEQYSLAEQYILNQLELATVKQNYTQEVMARVQQGIIRINKSEYDKVQPCIDAADIAAQKTNDKIARLYADYLHIYYFNTMGEYEKAIMLTQKILPEAESLSTETLLSAKLNYILYGIYSELNDEQNATKYALRSIELAKKSGNKNILSSAYSALAVCYSYRYEKSRDLKDLKLVIETCKMAIDLFYKFPGRVSDYAHSMALLNLANYYLSYPVITAEIQKKIKSSAEEVLKITQQMINSQNVQAGAWGILSNLAMRNNDTYLAEQYLLKAESIALTQKPVYYHILINIVSDLAGLYSRQQNYAKAYNYQAKVTEYSNLLYSQSQAETTKKLEAQYQSIQKEQELKNLTEKAGSLKREKYLYISLGIFGLIGTFFMFRSYHFKLRYSIEREKKLNTEKHDAELQVKLEKEEQARLKAEQDLLTLQQQKLQDEVLASHLHLQHKNEVLQQLKVKLNDDKSLNINQIIREENLLDNDFEKAKFQIQKVHPNFFKNLSLKSNPNLTSLDLKYCAYLYLGMDTKQIANILNVEPKSVRMTKYRLKKKFGLNEDTDLDMFIKSILS